MFCKKCGAQIDDSAVYCYNCGYVYEKSRQVQPDENFNPPIEQQPIAQKQKSKVSIWYTVIMPITAVLLVVAIALGLNVSGAFNGGSTWQVEIPDVVGKQYEKADKMLENKKLHCLIADKIVDENVDENKVLLQDPTAGMIAGKGSIVDVVLSAGSGKIYMPNVENYSKDYANDVLTKQGFTVEYKNAKGDYDKFAPNSVCYYSLADGEGVEKGETVIVYIKPPTEIQSVKYTMPKIVGRDFAEAQNQLYKDGVYIAIEKFEYSDTVPANQVIEQSVKENEQIDKNSTVYVTVSLGREKIFMPDVTYMTEENAKRTLEIDGVKVKTEYAESADIAKGSVIEQKVKAGTQIEKGAEVTLIVSSGYTVTVPYVVGLSEKEAVDRIISSDLSVNVVYEYGENKAVNSVSAQDKKAYDKVQIGSVVTITVITDKPNTDINSSTADTQKPEENPDSSNQFLEATQADFDKLIGQNVYWVYGFRFDYTDEFDNTKYSMKDAIESCIMALILPIYDTYFPKYTSYFGDGDSYFPKYKPDPLNKYNKYKNYSVAPAENVEWIIKNVLNMEIDRNYISDGSYYYNNNYYAEFGQVGDSCPTFKLVSTDRLDDGKYKVKVASYDTMSLPIGVYYDLIVSLKNIDGKRVWSYYSIKGYNA